MENEVDVIEKVVFAMPTGCQHAVTKKMPLSIYKTYRSDFEGILPRLQCRSFLHEKLFELRWKVFTDLDKD